MIFNPLAILFLPASHLLEGIKMILGCKRGIRQTIVLIV